MEALTQQMLFSTEFTGYIVNFHFLSSPIWIIWFREQLRNFVLLSQVSKSRILIVSKHCPLPSSSSSLTSCLLLGKPLLESEFIYKSVE